MKDEAELIDEAKSELGWLIVPEKLVWYDVEFENFDIHSGFRTDEGIQLFAEISYLRACLDESMPLQLRLQKLWKTVMLYEERLKTDTLRKSTPILYRHLPHWMNERVVTQALARLIANEDLTKSPDSARIPPPMSKEADQPPLPERPEAYQSPQPLTPGETSGKIESKIGTTRLPLTQRVLKELKFMWNLVDPRHGRATVYVSRSTGEVVSKIKPQMKR